MQESVQSRSSMETFHRLKSSIFVENPVIINDAIILDDSMDDSGASLTMNFIPPKYVRDMHAAPRFGHTNRLGQIVSPNTDDSLEYAEGLKQFTLFVIVPFIIWAIFLVLFKYLYGIPKIGCAAGGEILDMKEMSKQGISRKQRKKRILRAWRLQTTFLMTSILIPTTSILMMQNGWKQLEIAWDEVRDIVDSVESLAFRGWNALDGLSASRDSLYENILVRDILRHQKNKNEASSPTTTLFSNWCPDANGNERLAFLKSALEQVEEQTESMVMLFDEYVPVNVGGFKAITDATQSTDDAIQWFFQNDWIWKMYLMVLNVLNTFLILCVYIFSKNDIIHPPTRFYLTFFVVPLFSVATGLLLMVTASSGVATLLNADFCSGGSDGQGSPQGTIQDAILSYSHGSVYPQQDVSGTLGLVYDSFVYYAEGCLSEHPLGFLKSYANQVEQSTSYIVELSENLPESPETLSLLNTECGADMSFLPSALNSLEKDLIHVQNFVESFVDITSCHSISPLVRRITHGAICEESAHGLTWIWASSLFICVCCFVMLTTRAALYNVIKKRKRRERKPRRVVEKEFEDYKLFMGRFYEDAGTWKLQDSEKKAALLEIDFEGIQGNPTFETMPTASLSLCEDDMSQQAGILSLNSDDSSMQKSKLVGRSSFLIDKDDLTDEHSETLRLPEVDAKHSSALMNENDNCQDSSDFDSDYESDSDESEESDVGDDESALLSFYTETKTILSETRSKASTIISLAASKMKRLRPLLGSPVDAESVSESIEEHFFSSPAPLSDGNSSFKDEADPYITPPSRLSSTELKTPAAPLKPLSFLGRTNAASLVQEELEPLTNTPPRESLYKNSKGKTFHPRRLNLSPIEDAKSEREIDQFCRRISSKPNSSRIHLGSTTPERTTHLPIFYNRTTRPRLESDDSTDSSLYIEDSQQ